MQTKSDLAQVLEFLRPYRLRLLMVLALTTALSITAMLPPLLTRAFIDRVVEGGQHDLFLPLSVGIVLVPLLAALIGSIQTIGIAYIGQHFVFDLRCALYRHLLNMSLRFFGKHSTGMLVNRLMGDSGVVTNMLSAQTIGIISDLVCSVFALVVTFLLNWRLALVIALIVAVFLANYRYNILRIRQASWRYKRSYDRMSGGVQNRLVAGLTVKTFGAEPREQDSFEEDSQGSAVLHQTAGLTSNVFQQNTALIQNMGRALLYFLGCAMVLRGDMSYGDVLAFTTYALQLLGPAVRFSELARQLQDMRIAVERIMELYRQTPEVQDAPNLLPCQSARDTSGRGRIEFDNVSFHYNAGQPVLRNFTLDVQPGETIALVGPTGCGKSTVMLLAMRFFDVCGGALRVDGCDVRKMRLRDLRARFGVVLQEPLLFNVSIAENIRYARPTAQMAEIEAAARVAEIHEFITTLPDGYHTMLGSEGLQLSTGQKQRLTIARAVLTDPAILVMDEATSALDTDSERAIQTALRRVLRDRTAFIIAHRLSTIRDAHRIVLISAGAIKEVGSHDELIARPDSAYRALYERHANKGVIEG